MYKDRDKRKEASRERMRRYRSKDVTPKDVTPKDVTPKPSLPQDIIDDINNLCDHRVAMGLDDDRQDRVHRALEYLAWYPTRLTSAKPLVKLM